MDLLACYQRLRGEDKQVGLVAQQEMILAMLPQVRRQVNQYLKEGAPYRYLKDDLVSDAVVKLATTLDKLRRHRMHVNENKLVGYLAKTIRLAIRTCAREDGVIRTPDTTVRRLVHGGKTTDGVSKNPEEVSKPKNVPDKPEGTKPDEVSKNPDELRQKPTVKKQEISAKKSEEAEKPVTTVSFEQLEYEPTYESHENVIDLWDSILGACQLPIERQVIELRSAGCSAREIAQRLGYTRFGVYAILRRVLARVEAEWVLQ